MKRNLTHDIQYFCCYIYSSTSIHLLYFNTVKGNTMKIHYEKNMHNPMSISFTATGHVDMDDFDEQDTLAHSEPLATFYDKEFEKFCRHGIKAYEDHVEKQHEEDLSNYTAEYESVYVNRTLLQTEEDNSHQYDIAYFWREFIDGLELDWGKVSDSDINGIPFNWREDKILLTQIPKHKDFLFICQEVIADEMRMCTYDNDDISAETGHSWLSEKVRIFLALSQNIYPNHGEDVW